MKHILRLLFFSFVFTFVFSQSYSVSAASKPTPAEVQVKKAEAATSTLNRQLYVKYTKRINDPTTYYNKAVSETNKANVLVNKLKKGKLKTSLTSRITKLKPILDNGLIYIKSVQEVKKEANLTLIIEKKVYDLAFDSNLLKIYDQYVKQRPLTQKAVNAIKDKDTKLAFINQYVKKSTNFQNGYKELIAVYRHTVNGEKALTSGNYVVATDFAVKAHQSLNILQAPTTNVLNKVVERYFTFTKNLADQTSAKYTSKPVTQINSNDLISFEVTLGDSSDVVSFDLNTMLTADETQIATFTYNNMKYTVLLFINEEAGYPFQLLTISTIPIN